MYTVNQCSNPRNLLLPGDKTIKISVLSGKSIFSVDAKAITSDMLMSRKCGVVFSNKS